MGGAAPDMARRKRLRSGDRAMIIIQSDEDDEGKKMSGSVNVVKNRKTSSSALLEKGKQKEGRTNSNKNMMPDEQAKEDKMKKSRKKVSPASLEKMKKGKLCNDNKKKKMKICDDKEGKNRFPSDHRLKNRKESTMLSEKEKNNKKMNKTHKEKVWAADSNERKILSGHNRVQKSGQLSNAFVGKEKKGKMLNKAISEELQTVQSDEDDQEEVLNHGSKVKNGKVAATFSEEDKRKKRPNNTNTEKGTAPLTPAVKEKRMRPSESTEMMFHNKPNQRNVSSNVSKEKKMDTSSGSNYKKRKREEPQSLSKKERRGWCDDNDKKTRYGRVQEKKENKICGSRKENNRKAPFGFLKFIYNYFEEFLLIPPAVAPELEDLTNQLVYLEDSEKRRSKVRLSVVDGSLAFHQGWNIFVSDHLIKPGEFLLFDRIARTIFSVRVFGIDSRERLCFKKDPKRVEHGVGSGPAQKDKDNEILINKQCKTNDASPLRNKEKTAILISFSGTSAHNEDIVSLTMSDADSRHHVTITNKDLKRVQSGVGNLPDVECGTKCISPTCSEIKQSSEITVTDAAPLAHESECIMENELEVHDLDDDLTRKQGINSIHLDSITAVEKYQNNSETNISQNFDREYTVPGGFRCLEKWSKVIVNSRASLDGTVLIEPEKTWKNGSNFFDGYGSIGLNGNGYFCSEGNHTRALPVFIMPIEEPSSADRVSKCRHGRTEIDHNIIEKGGGVAVQIETQGEQLEPVGSIVNSRRNNIPVAASTVVLGNYGALGLNPGVPEGTCAFVESILTVPVEKPPSPDLISKCESSRAEIDHNVNGEGTIVQLETKLDQVEAVGHSVCSKSSNVAIYVNHAPEHFLSEQEDRKSINCATMESLLPMNDGIELDDDSLLEFDLQLCVPDTTRKWLVLPKSLSGVFKQKRQPCNCNLIQLKDPMKRLWPVLYYNRPLFVGFTAGWKDFVAGNNLQAGDLCNLIKEPDDDEPVYSVHITRQTKNND